MKAVISTPVARTDISWYVGTSENHVWLAQVKKIGRKRDRARLKAFLQKEAITEVKADIVEAIEAKRLQREQAYRELMHRIATRRRSKKLERLARLEAAAQAEVNRLYGFSEEPILYEPRTEAFVLDNGERKLVASCA